MARHRWVKHGPHAATAPVMILYKTETLNTAIKYDHKRQDEKLKLSEFIKLKKLCNYIKITNFLL